MAAKLKPYELEMQPLPLEKFHWDKEQKTLSAEMSDFGSAREGPFWLQRLYNDAADIGIAIYSDATDRTERFVLVKEHKDKEGDLQYFEFSPLNLTLKSKVRKVVIFND